MYRGAKSGGTINGREALYRKAERAIVILRSVYNENFLSFN